MARFFGTPDGVKVGDLFIDRDEVRAAQLHLPRVAGISGTKSEGADSIVLSGGYDDRDYGDFIIYTGHGGRKRNSRTQTFDQSTDSWGNAGLITSYTLGLPVRVIRGAHKGNPYAPPSGYQYAGLFLVTHWWLDIGTTGFKVVKFRLDRISEQAELVTRAPATSDPAFAKAIVSRRIRDTQLTREVKALYDYQCQVCASAIPGFGQRRYAEGAHVRPLGRPHLGADALSNILCLCPNHHAQLDIGGMVILDDLTVARSADLDPFAELTFRRDHRLELENAQYHRAQWGVS